MANLLLKCLQVTPNFQKDRSEHTPTLILVRLMLSSLFVPESLQLLLYRMRRYTQIALYCSVTMFPISALHAGLSASVLAVYGLESAHLDSLVEELAQQHSVWDMPYGLSRS